MILERVKFSRLSNGVWFHRDGEWFKKVADRAAVRADGVLILDGYFSVNGVPKQLPDYEVDICRDSLRSNPSNPEVQHACG
jgi:hypothetical protein